MSDGKDRGTQVTDDHLKRDLAIMRAMAADLGDYLNSSSTHWTMATGRGDMPPLTIGGYLMRRRRLAALGEELHQQLRRGSPVDPAVDLGRVVAGRLVEHARAVLDAAALGIGSAEIEPADTRERDGSRAHGAGLQRHVEIAAGEPFLAEHRAGGADGQQLGMRGRVFQLARAVAGGICFAGARDRCRGNACRS